jgi:hypothetical protein
VEDCRHVTGRPERDLLAAGEQVVRVPPRLMAGARVAVRALGKSDPIDALAVARAALREPDLPPAGHDPASWEVKLLVDHREHLIAERPEDDQPAPLAPAPARPRARARRPTAARPIAGRIALWLAGAPASAQVGSARSSPPRSGR